MPNKATKSTTSAKKRSASPISKKDQPEEKRPFVLKNEEKKDAEKKKPGEWLQPEQPIPQEELRRKISEAEKKGPLAYPGYSVQCRQRNQWFGVRVLITEMNPKVGVYQYYVHYHGYRRSHDEWVDESRVRELTQENIIAAKEELDALLARRKKSKQNKPLEEETIEDGEEVAPVETVPTEPEPGPSGITSSVQKADTKTKTKKQPEKPSTDLIPGKFCWQALHNKNTNLFVFFTIQSTKW